MGVVGGRLVVFGGRGGAGRSVERFYPESGWQEVQGLEVDFRYGGAVFPEPSPKSNSL